MRKTSRTLIVFGLVPVVMAALMSASLIAGAMQENANANANANTATKATGTKHIRRTTKSKTKAAEATAGAETTKAAPQKKGRCDRMQQEQTDLSGTYTGKVNYPDAGLTGDATLTITGNNFTLTSGSTTQTGRVTAETTCGYIGVTMMFGDTTPPAAGKTSPALPAVSLRARKMSDRVTMMTVPGETRTFSFGTAGAMKAGARKHKAKAKPAAATATPTP